MDISCTKLWSCTYEVRVYVSNLGSYFDRVQIKDLLKQK